MPKLSRKIIGENLKNLRNALGLTQTDIGNMLSISKRSLANLESGAEFDSFDILNRLLDFYGLTVNDIAYDIYDIQLDFRETMTKKYSDHIEYLIPLSKTPPIVYGIRYKLLMGEFLVTPKETIQIKKYFETFGWNWKGTSISTALKRRENIDILILPHPTKKGTALFKKIEK